MGQFPKLNTENEDLYMLSVTNLCLLLAHFIYIICWLCKPTYSFMAKVKKNIAPIITQWVQISFEESNSYFYASSILKPFLT